VRRYTASQARQRFADLLDAAERGEAVMIERGERRFVLTAEKRTRRKKAAPTRIEWMDPAVTAGEWTWKLGPQGLAFRPQRRRSRR
jgi:antitoxin (DNA-binding transcriptional repressor) of toxin-antitoxin stability system